MFCCLYCTSCIQYVSNLFACVSCSFFRTRDRHAAPAHQRRKLILPNKQNPSSPSVHTSFARSRGANQLTRAATNTFGRAAAARGKRGEKVRMTKSEISMRTWRSFLRAAAQGAFVLIPEISHSDISYIISDPCAALAGGKHTRMEIRCSHRALFSCPTHIFQQS